MTDVLAALRRQAIAGPTARIALPEAEDSRILEAADEALRIGLCEPLLIGRPDRVRIAADDAGIPLDARVLDPEADPHREQLAESFILSLEERGLKAVNPRALALTPLYHAGLLVRAGRASGAIMGAVATTAESLRAALRTVGVAPQYKTVTSCFLMALADGRNLIYADCGVVPEPTAEQLADIAMQAADAYRLLVGDEPRVALLSFSTKGSALFPGLKKIRDALDLLSERGANFAFDGELQADAALIEAVAMRKAPESPVAGQANVLVFPDLNSGNIAYKLTERLAGARAIGPLLRGLDRPLHDLSRGCSASDILDTMAIIALEAGRRRAR